eukprot:2402655-Pleurochrysis_carterae.AAC.6
MSVACRRSGGGTRSGPPFASPTQERSCIKGIPSARARGAASGTLGAHQYGSYVTAINIIVGRRAARQGDQ